MRYTCVHVYWLSMILACTFFKNWVLCHKDITRYFVISERDNVHVNSASAL